MGIVWAKRLMLNIRPIYNRKSLLLIIMGVLIQDLSLTCLSNILDFLINKNSFAIMLSSIP